jgi:hypothetical protein
MEDYINELKAEAEASMLKTVEKLLIQKTACGVDDATFWSKIIRDITEVENKLKEERREKNRLKKKQREADTFIQSMSELVADCPEVKYEVLTELYDDAVKAYRQSDKMKQFAMGVHNFAYGTEYDDVDIVSSFEFTSILDKMKHAEKCWIDEVADLRKEVADLKKERTKYKHMVENVWVDLYYSENEGKNLSFDEVAGSVEYEENKDYIATEVVDDDGCEWKCISDAPDKYKYDPIKKCVSK